MLKPKVIIALNSSWNLINFRSGLICALVAEGYEVVALAPDDAYSVRLSELGCRFVPLPMDNQGTHPLRDLLLFIRLWLLLRRERPDVLLAYTVKPNVYASLAAGLLSIPVVNNIAGLGAVFIKGGWLVRLVRGLYRLALRRSAKVFFQNGDDRALFIDAGLVKPEKTDLLPGSGIDLTRFSANEKSSMPSAKDVGRPFRFLLIARMLRDKGVVEYVAAAKQIRARWPNVECALLGFLDVQNPAAISTEEMNAWVAAGDVRYLGVSDDVRLEIAQADCIVLPSYREGTPRTLLEAAAMAKPIITTDAVGCREVVDDGVNGYLCQVRDANDLAAKMHAMLVLSVAERAAMGQAGRKKMELQFDEKIVIDKYLQVVSELAGKPA
ncbi:MAG: glycosyltransferase family 4 protein [Sulfuritalea sp.]|nr:glycosyltransferase family 4 protein [Sulfuritalea sp.]